MWLCVLQSLLVSASGDDSESQAPWPTSEGKPDPPWVPSLEKPTGWTFPVALPPSLLILPLPQRPGPPWFLLLSNWEES